MLAAFVLTGTLSLTFAQLSDAPRPAVAVSSDDDFTELRADIANALAADTEHERRLGVLAARAHAAGLGTELAAIAAALSGSSDEALSAAVALLSSDLESPRPRDDDWFWNFAPLIEASVASRRFDHARCYLVLAVEAELREPVSTFSALTFEAKIAEGLRDFTTAVRATEALRTSISTTDLDDGLASAAFANLGNLEFAIGDLSSCVKSWDNAIACGERSGETRFVKLALVDRCNFHRLRRDMPALARDADRLVAFVLAEGDAASAADRFDAHYQRGYAWRAMGELAHAQSSYETALAAARSPQREPAKEAAALDGLALVALGRGELERAQELVCEALAIERKFSDHTYLLDTLQTAVALALACGDARAARNGATEALALLEDGDLLLMGPRRAVALRARYAEWSELECDIAAMEHRHATTDAERLRAACAGLASMAAWTGRSLSLATARDTRLDESVASSIRQALNGARLVHYANGRDRTYAFVVDERSTQLIDIGPRAAIEVAVEAFVDGLLVHTTLVTPLEVGRSAYSLHQILVAPILAADASPLNRLVVVPTATLMRLPFDALVDRVPDVDVARFDQLSFLVDSVQITVCPSASALPDLVERGATAPSTAIHLFGGAQFAPIDGHRPAELPHSRVEVLSVVDALLPREGDERSKFNEAIADAGASMRFATARGLELYLGAHATPAQVKAIEGPVAVLYFATHGFEVDLDPDGAGLLLSPDASGDSVLDAGEIRALACRPDLVVLSACSTATGPLLRGDGLQSIANAFLELGAREVVASLCPVADDETCLLMSEFQRVRASGVTTAEALRRAKLERRHAMSRSSADVSTRFGIGARGAPPTVVPPGHPRTWAPFVVVGG